MKKIKTLLLYLTILFITSILYSQTLVEMGAAAAIQDNLAAQQAGPSTEYINRAQMAVNPPAIPPEGATVGEGTLSSYMPGQPLVTQGQQVQPQVEIPKMTVIEGTRVYCRVCGKLLQEAIRKQIPATDENKSRYYDDGQNGGDLVANDGIYTNVEISRDYIGPECADVRNKLITFLNRAEKESAVDFFRMTALSNDPVSSLAKTYEKEGQKDEYLKIWRNKFLSKYKKNPDDPNSEFLAIYVPKPPEYPSLSFQTQAQLMTQGRPAIPGISPGQTREPINEAALFGEGATPTPAPTPVPVDEWGGQRKGYYDTSAMTGGK